MAHLPGQVLKAEKNARCEEHEDRVSVHRVVGETDSWGSEYCEMCQECYDKYLAAVEAERNTPRLCECCKTMKLGVKFRRDLNEGSSGPVYEWCGGCYNRMVDDFVGDDDEDRQDTHDDFSLTPQQIAEDEEQARRYHAAFAHVPMMEQYWYRKDVEGNMTIYVDVRSGDTAVTKIVIWRNVDYFTITNFDIC